MKKCVLGDICTKIGSGATPTGGRAAYAEEGVSLIRSQNVLDLTFSYGGLAYLNDSQADKLKSVAVQPNDVLLNITGDSVARSCMVDEKVLPARVNQHVAIVRVKKEVANPYYIMLWLVWQKKRLLLLASNGATRHALTKEMIEELPIDLPTLAEQSKIALLLSTIDRKIALNRKRIATLEAMAKEIYDYWFVQFDFPDAHGRPYKSSGGAMVYNPDLKREIPKGWEVGVLPDIVEFTNGLPCQRFRPRPGERSLPVLKIKEMHDGITDQTERVKEDIPERFKVYDGDIIFSWSASLEVMVWFYGKAGLNQHIFKVTEKDGWPIHFSFFLLSDYVAIFRRIAESRKTTMGHITSDHLRLSTVPLPQHKVVVEKFEEIVRPIFDALVNAAHEVSNLVNMRDTLLPLLMNGQVKVG